MQASLFLFVAAEHFHINQDVSTNSLFFKLIMIVRDSPPGAGECVSKRITTEGRVKKIEREKNEANLIKISKYGISSDRFVNAGFNP